MQATCADTNFSPKTKLSAVCKARAGVMVNAGTIDLAQEPLGNNRVRCNNSI
jgi:hypothetical protein